MSKNEAFAKGSRGFKEIAWIPVKNLSIVWQQSQRLLNQAHADRIAAEFDPEMFGLISVTKPNGSGIYHVIDGQHRRAAIEKIWGLDERVPCQVFDAEDPARAAELFGHINTARKAPSPVDVFRVRVTAKEEPELSIGKIVTAAGYTVSHWGTHNSTNITAVSALKSVYLSYGAKVLKDTLDAITAIWGNNDKGAVSGIVVRGIGEFLAEFRQIDYVRLREAIGSKYTPARLQGGAKGYRELHGGSAATAVKELIVVAYNTGIRSAAKKLKSQKGD